MFQIFFFLREITGDLLFLVEFKKKVFKYLNIRYRIAYSSCHTFMNDMIYNQVIHIHINVIINQ